MGQLFTRLFTTLACRVISIDLSDGFQAKAMLAKADAVLVAVPIAVTEAVIQQIGPLLKAETVLSDITSLKKQPLAAMMSAHAGPVIGLHPVFGPTVSTFQGQVMVCCPGRQVDASHWFMQLFLQAGLTCEWLSAEAHDSYMDFVQGIQHFCTIAMGAFLAQSKIDLSTLLKLSSPAYEVQLGLIGRIFDQDAALYSDIICSDSMRRARIAAFIELVTSLGERIQAGDRDALINTFEQTRAWMGDFTHAAQEKSDQLFTFVEKKLLHR